MVRRVCLPVLQIKNQLYGLKKKTEPHWGAMAQEAADLAAELEAYGLAKLKPSFIINNNLIQEHLDDYTMYAI